MNWDAILKAAPIAAAVAALFAATGALIAAFSYRHNVRLKRGEWLQRLFQQFYEQERYRYIRDLLDYRQERELVSLHEHLHAETRDAYVDQLWDYLNFFEFVEGLVKLKQISAEDRNYLFEYPLRRIGADKDGRDALRREGFERLAAYFGAQL